MSLFKAARENCVFHDRGRKRIDADDVIGEEKHKDKIIEAEYEEI